MDVPKIRLMNYFFYSYNYYVMHNSSNQSILNMFPSLIEATLFLSIFIFIVIIIIIIIIIMG